MSGVFQSNRKQTRQMTNIPVPSLSLCLCRLVVKCYTSSTCTCWAVIISGCSVKASICTHLLWWLYLQRSNICTGTTSLAGVSQPIWTLFVVLFLFVYLFHCVSYKTFLFPYWTQAQFKNSMSHNWLEPTWTSYSMRTWTWWQLYRPSCHLVAQYFTLFKAGIMVAVQQEANGTKWMVINKNGEIDLRL